MYEENKENVKNIVMSIKQKNDKKMAGKLNMNMLERCVDRTNSFSDDCERCRDFIIEIEKQLIDLEKNFDSINKETRKAYLSKLNEIIAHLQKQHKLVADGYYTGMYMMFGVALGVPLGMLFNNTSLGIPIGLCLGVAIGASMDANAKKKGQVI